MIIKKPRTMFIRNSKNLFLAIFCFLFVLGQLASPLSSLAATYIFSQDDWSGGESIDVATHTNDQDGWTKFLDEEGLETNSGLSSSFLPEQIELTDDIDFSGGDNSQTRIDGSGSNALVELGKTGFVDAKIFSDGSSTYALKPDGTLYAWGRNNYGQLGDGTTTNRSTPVQVKGVDGVGYLTDVEQVFTDGYFAYALKTDGTLYAWGSNSNGKLGDGTWTDRSTPVQVKGVDGVGYLTDVEQVFANGYSAYALKPDGTLYAWGYNNYGQLGDGTTINRSTPVQVKGVGGVGYLTDVEQVFTNGYSAYALKTDGTLYAWGYSNGKLGDGTTADRSTPTQVKGVDGVGYLTDVEQVFADGSSVYALKTDGTLYAWGSNGYGQLGDGTMTNRSTPVQVKGVDGVGYLTDVEQVFAGGYSAYALKTDGTLYAWGSNSYGKLGDGTMTYRYTPIQVKGVDGVGYLTDVEQVFANGYSAYALKPDGTLYAWGYNNYGQLGDGTTTNRSTPVQVKGVDGVGYLTDVEQVFAGGYSAYALKTDGTLYAWGSNSYGKLGDGTTIDKHTPVLINKFEEINPLSYLTSIKEIININYSYYALKTDGTLYAWGSNSYGQLGDGTTTNRSTPVQVKGVDGVGYLTDVEQVFTDGYSAYALKTDGTLYAWGYNNYGQLGDGTTINRSTPVQVKGVGGVGYLTDVEQVFTDGYSAYALKTDGTLYAWGYNYYSQLGDGTTTNRSTPIQVKGVDGVGYLTDVEQVFANNYFAYALKPDGTLYAWGYNNYGQLGDGTTTNRSTPVQVKGVDGVGYLTDVEQVFAGGYSAYALKTDGTLYAWGSNSNGRLGDGTTTNRSTPVQVKGVDGVGYLTDVEQVFANGSSVYALKPDGTLYAWGYNNYGQLGDGTTTNRSTPVQVKGVDGVGYLTDVEQVFAGGYSAYALKTDGTLYAWGSNSNGRLGDGTTTNRSTPVQVKGVDGVGYLTDVEQVFANGSSVYALKPDGTLYAWGRNDSGRLGDGTTTNRSTPVQVKGVDGVGYLTDVEQVFADGSLAYALKTDGTLYAWGYNYYSQLGDGTTTNRSTPVQVKGVDGVGYLTDVEQFFIYNNSAYAIKSDGTLYTWGYNYYGQLGDGTTTDSSLPIQPREWEITYDPSFHIGVNEYYSSGTYTSDIVDLGGPASLNTLDYVVDLKGQSLTVDVRAGNTLEPDSSWSDWINNLANGADISSLGENKYIQYRLNLSTGNTTVSPELQSITFNYNKYVDEGYLISSVYDTNDQFNLIGQIDWVLENETETEYSKFQIRSSANGTDWSSWCGYADCSGDTYFESEDKGESLPDGHPLISGADDRYIQYKVFLYSAGGQSASLNSVSLSYVVNAPPSFEVDYMEEGSSGVVAYQEDSQEDDYFGKVKIFYSAKDIDSTSGTNTPNKISPSFSYSIDGGLNWTAISEEDLEEGDMSLQTIEEEVFSEYQAVWDANKTISTIETENAQIKVTINDGELANNIAEAISPNFNLDSKAPTIVENITFDAGVAGQESSATITIPRPEEISQVSYYISDDPLIESNPQNTGWVVMDGEEVAIPWTFDSDVEVKSLKYKFKDVFGNETAEMIASTHTPVATSSFMVQDTSNISAVPPYYDVYIGWQASEETGFSSYKLEQATSSDNITYNDYVDISSASLSNYTTNYYISRNLDPDLYYKYRLGVVNSEGNVSVRSNASIITKPDGVQNYGEGGGGSVATAPRIENITATQQADKSVIVNFKLTDDSLVKKIYPNYEAYLFYNHGVTVASNYLSGGNLEVSDATLLPESGYIQVNNEVIKYTTKNGNILSGLSRGTWPNKVTSGRATRTSAVLYEGSPVWVMANHTEPITIENTSILSGQNEEMVWLAQEEESLAGFSYDNFGLRVLIHDNQDALSGPISTQNDYSEDSLINNLDLEAPFISFEVAEMSVIENTDSIVSIPLNLERSYMFDSTVNYTVSGTATRGLDYILADGQVTIEAGQIQNSINLSIIDDAIKEEPENLIITLSDPNNTRLGSNPIITITIGDNESFSGLGFDLVASSNTENITLVPVKIILAEVSGIDVTASYTVSGTAIRDEDYVLADGSITILAGDDEAIIDLYITDDALKETDETVVITINEVTGATLNENSVYTYTIVDNDTYPTISFSQPTSQAREDINVAEILVSLSSAYPEEVRFNYSIVGGSAEGDGVDYRVEETEAIIEPGSTTGLVPIIIYDDDLSEETENILVSIHDPVNAILGSEVTHGLSILDNEILITEINGSQTKSTSVRITWTTDDYTDSLIEYGLVPDGQEGAYAMSKHSTEKVLNHDVYIDELTPETTYYFRTTSTNLAGETTVSRSQFTTTAGPVISQVSTTGETDTTATITWTTDILSNSVVYYSTDPEMLNPQSQNTSDQTTDHSVSLNNLTPNEIYYFFVTSTDEEGNIGEDLDGGNYYSFSTEDDETPPTISNILIPVRTNSQVAITWRTNEQADGLIRYGLDPEELENESELIELPLIDHLIALDNLEEETTYYYVIESADENGNKTISSPQTFETTKKERVVVFAGSGTPGVAQELYDMILAENQAYKARLDSLNDIKPEISDVEISNITAFSADVSFRTSEDTVAFVKYGKEGSLDKMVANNDWSRNHLINLSGLSLGTEYAFVISVMDKSNDRGESEEYTFTTRYLAEDLDELKKIENVEQFQKEIESTIESILPSLVPPFIERPTVTNITESSATISYKTNIKTYPIVSFVEESKYDLTKENPYNRENSNTTEKSNSHNLELTGLMPNTKYHFSARAYSLPGVIGQYEDLTFMTKASKIQAQIANITNSSFDVIWTTDEPTSSIVEYKNTRTGKIAKIVDEKKIVSHSIKVENLESGVSFEVFVSGINPKGNLVEAGSSRVVKTLLDEDAPIVANLKVDSAMVQGRNDKVQTIISWQTNEPSTSTIRYQEGTGKLDSNLSNSAKDLELTQNHVVILSSLKPGTVYRFTIVSTDQAGNSSELPVRTIITPNKTESIVDVIFKNFDETFNFIKNIR